MRYIIKNIFFIIILTSSLQASSGESHFCFDRFLQKIDFPKETQSSFLFQELLKTKHFHSKKNLLIDDLSDSKLSSLKENFLPGAKLSKRSSHEDFVKALESYPVADLIVSPGNRYKSPIKQTKTTFNIITDKNGVPLFVDLWGDPSVLLPYLEANKSLSQVINQGFEVLLNGSTKKGTLKKHVLSSSGVNLLEVPLYDLAPGFPQGFIKVSGEISNYQLGSRNTLKQFKVNITLNKKSKVGVYFGTFNPMHEGHFDLAQKARDLYNLDEVLIVPNINPLHKKDILDVFHRNKIISERIKDEKGINLYTGNSGEIINNFGRNTFFERVIQIYGTNEIYQIVGDDSFLRNLQTKKLHENKYRKFLIFKRKNGPNIPPQDPNKVIISDYEDENGFSSSKIRKMIKSGKKPSPKELHPDEYKYIIEKGLFQ